MRREIALLLAAENTWLLGEGLLGPLFALFAQKVGGNLLEVAWLWATYLGLTGVMIMLVGRVSDRVGKERLLFGGFALNAVFTFGYLLVDSPTTLLVAEIGLAVAAALATPTWDSLYSHYQQKRESGYLWGMHAGQAYVVTGLATFAGGLVVSAYSFGILFIVMGVLQILATLMLVPLLRRSTAA